MRSLFYWIYVTHLVYLIRNFLLTSAVSSHERHLKLFIFLIVSVVVLAVGSAMILSMYKIHENHQAAYHLPVIPGGASSALAAASNYLKQHTGYFVHLSL